MNIQLYLQEILNNAQRLKQISCLVFLKPYKIKWQNILKLVLD